MSTAGPLNDDDEDGSPFPFPMLRRKGLALCDERLYDLVNDLTQLSKDRLLVIAMAATVYQLRCAPDEH